MGYGKSKYGSEQKFQKTGKPGKGPGNNFIRIMPAMHSLADEGKWALYFTTHWGYAGVSPGDPTKTVVRPFRCIEDKDRRSGMVRQACPECDNFRAQEAEATAFEAALKAETKDGKPKYTADEIKTAMKSRADWLQAHGPERKWYINVMYKDRTFGDYKINHKTHKKGIDSKIAELWDNQQIDATDLDTGVWFNIKRLGDGFTVPDVVEVETEQQDAVVNGKTVKVAVTLSGALTAEEQARGLKECRDLSTLGGTVLTEEQIQALVDSDGSPEAIDQVFGARPTAATREAIAPAAVSKAAGAAAAQVEKFTAKLKETVKEPQPATKEKPPGAINTAAQEALLARAAQAKANLKAKAAAAAAAAEAEAAAAVTPGQNPLEMDDESFLAFFNSQQAAQS